MITYVVQMCVRHCSVIIPRCATNTAYSLCHVTGHTQVSSSKPTVPAKPQISQALPAKPPTTNQGNSHITLTRPSMQKCMYMSLFNSTV